MSGRPGTELASRFDEHLRRSGILPTGEPLIVAVSGGLDSTVLLHLLRFGTLGNPLVVAHFDHAMRPGSAADARWVAGLAAGWVLPFESGRAATPPTSEAEARRLRYGFLDQIAERCRAGGILTAHHADDQAETVLFRALRGTGVRGLRGIGARAGTRIRPLLPFWRREILAHAEAVGLRWREDPTNRKAGPARNVLRNEILPRVEAEVAPGARRALVRLARHAAAAEAEWRGVEGILFEEVLEAEEAHRIVLARSRLLAHDRPVRARLLRRAVRRLGSHLSDTGTRLAMEFTSRGESGRAVDLPGGLNLGRSFDALVLAFVRASTETPAPPPESSVLIDAPGAGSEVAVIGGRPRLVEWGADGGGGAGPESARFDPAALRFPLRIRGPLPGDRMRLQVGTKKVAKVLAEAHVPRDERGRTPLVVDAGGRVLWAPGVARGVEAVPEAGAAEFYIRVDDAHSS